MLLDQRAGGLELRGRARVGRASGHPQDRMRREGRLAQLDDRHRVVHDVRRVAGESAGEGASAPGWLDVDLSLRCSSGTYVRALARDLGRDLGTGGHLTSLRRTAVGPYDLATARSLEQLADDMAHCRGGK